MSSLQKRIHAAVHEVIDRYDGAWLLWCDPHGAWAPLLRRVAGNASLGGFALLEVARKAVADRARRRSDERR